MTAASTTDPVGHAPDETSKEPREVIQLWRAAACLAVVLFHASQSVRAAHPVVATLADVLGRNGPRLAIFFVISGYCLARSIEARSSSASGVVVFWRQRLTRIFPAYWAALLLAILLGLLATPFNGLPTTAPLPASALAWLGDLSLTSLWLGFKPSLLVSWTLNHELGFYLLMGFALLIPHRVARIAFYLLLTCIALFPATANWLPLLHVWPQFACGLIAWMALAPSLPRLVRRLAVLALALLAVGALAAGQTADVYAPAAALCLILSLLWIKRPPRVSPLCLLIGAASYSIYLVHIPFMSPFLNLARRWVPEQHPAFIVVWLVHIVFGVVAGCAFYRWVELPLNRRFAWRPRIKPASASPPEPSFAPLPSAAPQVTP